MRIRLVTAADADAIIALWHCVFPEYADPARPQRDPRANIDRKLAAGDGLFWLGETDGAIAGTVMAGYDGHRGWIYSLGVHPALRRRGLARRLVAFAEHELAARGCPKINLQVLTAKDDARVFWETIGYREDPVISLGKRLAG